MQHKTVLIANRSEIACRIIKSAKEIGLRTVALYSDTDQFLKHVSLADEAYSLSGMTALDSYLNIDKVITIAKKARADFIHPGYGFLSENVDFAKACLKANITWVGPHPDVLEKLGLKHSAKKIAQSLNIPTVASALLADDINLCKKQASEIGYPLILKPVAGGGGKGMHVVHEENALSDAIARAKREALISFNNDQLMAEAYLSAPRHIEIQIAADAKGNTVALFERECSIQRRSQKILEEAGDLGLDETTVTGLHQAACAIGKAVGYQGLGTVEFLVSAERKFYFMEVNPRLQVEHPVTECITDIDLVALQFHLASNQDLPFKQDELKKHGHSIEVRLCAENPENGFLPATGLMTTINFPNSARSSERIRIDAGYQSGDQLTPFFDSLIAKIIVHAKTRAQAFSALQNALLNTQCGGIANNLNFLTALVYAKDVLAQKVHTQWLENYLATDSLHPKADAAIYCYGALADYLQQKSKAQAQNPWFTQNGLRVNLKPAISCQWETSAEPLNIMISPLGENRYELMLEAEPFSQIVQAIFSDRTLVLSIDGHTHHYHWYAHPGGGKLASNTQVFQFKRVLDALSQKKQDHTGSISAPMPGLVTAVFVKEGQHIKAGDKLATLEAMKMEHTLKAPHDGTIESVHVGLKEQVEEGRVLFQIVK